MSTITTAQYLAQYRRELRAAHFDDDLVRALVIDLAHEIARGDGVSVKEPE